MFFKRIEILGFKSFADRTVIELTDGITALLGPNGCGKSNIVDAIKWVLGEQSVRNMRAERMDDVIFSGTEDRKAMNVSDVKLVISNEEGILQLDNPEIEIRRRVFRDGDSEYFLNALPVRLKEIRELLFDTGIGKSAYSVMEQGKIEQVLSHKPEDRRRIFEEVAGITRYIVRGSEAERKLEKTRQNMEQVENILREVRRRYEVLKKQTDKTILYRKLKQQSFELDKDIKLLQWKDLEQKRHRLNERLTSKISSCQKVETKIEGLKKSLAGELDLVNQKESQLIEHQKKLYGIDIEKENHDKQISMLKERKNEAHSDMENSVHREKTLMETLNDLQQQKDNRTKDRDDFQSRLNEIENSISSCQKTIQSAEARIKRIHDERDGIKESLSNQDKLNEELQGALYNLTETIVGQLDAHLKESGYDYGSRRKLEEQINNKIDELKVRIAGRSNLLGDQTALVQEGKAMEILHQSAADFHKLSGDFDKLFTLFEQYQALGTSFLDNFLAPEGFITKKRELDNKINQSKQESENLKKIAGNLTEEQDVLTEKIRQTRKSLDDYLMANTRTIAQVTAANGSIQSTTREIEGHQNRLKEIRDHVLQQQAKIDNLEKQIRELVEKKQELKNRQEKLSQNMAGLKASITAETAKMTGGEEKMIELNSKKIALDMDKQKIQMEITHVDEAERQLVDIFQDTYSIDLTDFAERKTTLNESPSNLKGQLSNIKNQLGEIGQINLMAPEELAEVTERYEFLQNQLEDLQKGKENLIQVTEELRRESAALLMKTYKEVRVNFHQMFRRLFGGGRADIRLTNSDDPLNSGLEIYVQPPGKKLENISLLSGGERAMCAVALMFATFMTKPSPFCILDEVDAALDEANIQKFTNILSEFGKKTQFVVITHNKKTVAGARNLLGITMQESGISRLITLRLDGQERSDAIETENNH